MAEKKFFNKYPYTDFHEMNLDWIVNKTEDCVDAVEEFDDRLTTAEGDISSLKTRMTTAEGNITDLQGRMTTAETHIDLAEGAISDLQDAVSGAGDSISALGDRLTIVENQQETDGHAISELIGDMEAAEQDIDNLQSDMTQAQLDIDAAELDIDALQTATTRSGVPIQWTSTKGTPQGEIDLQKYGKIRVMYIYGYAEELTSNVGAADAFLTASLPPDSFPVENIDLMIPVKRLDASGLDLLRLTVGTDGTVTVYNGSETIAASLDSQIIHYVLTYNVL